MTKLNQAFIRAYGKEPVPARAPAARPQPAPASPKRAAPLPPADEADADPYLPGSPYHDEPSEAVAERVPVRRSEVTSNGRASGGAAPTWSPAPWATSARAAAPVSPEPPAAQAPVSEHAAALRPAASQPAVSQPAVSQPAVSQPAVSQPAASRDATGESRRAAGPAAVDQPPQVAPAAEVCEPRRASDAPTGEAAPGSASVVELWDASAFVIMPGMDDWAAALPESPRETLAADRQPAGEAPGDAGVASPAPTLELVERPQPTRAAEPPPALPVAEELPAEPPALPPDQPERVARADGRGERQVVDPPPEDAALDEDQTLISLPMPHRQGFVPAWEVARFSWPALCDRLPRVDPDFLPHLNAELQAQLALGIRGLVVTGAKAGEGCTTLSMCLARQAAAVGVRVALVDGQPDNPDLGERLGVQVQQGWREVLAQGQPLGEAAVKATEEGVTLFPSLPGDTPAEQADVPDLLAALVGEFDLVILDLGALQPASLRALQAGAAAFPWAGLVVRNLRSTSEDEALTTSARLRNAGLRRVAIIENFAKPTRK